MPRLPARWRIAISLAFVTALTSLSSCTTTLLWGARVSGSDPEVLATSGTDLARTPAGTLRLAVQLAGPLPEGCAPLLERGRSGQWLVTEITGQAAAVEEIARLATMTSAPAKYMVSLYTDGDILLDASVRLQPETLSSVRLQRGLRADFDSTLVTQAKGKALGIVDARPADGERLAAAQLRWWRPRPEEFRHTLPERVFYTPFTVVLDAVAMPCFLVSMLYGKVFNDLGGRW